MPTLARSLTPDSPDRLAPFPAQTVHRDPARKRRHPLSPMAGVLVALLTSAAAQAQSEATQSPVGQETPEDVVGPSGHIFEFGAQAITGKIVSPSGVRVEVRPRGTKRQLIRLRSNFRAQLRQTVDAL